MMSDGVRLEMSNDMKDFKHDSNFIALALIGSLLLGALLLGLYSCCTYTEPMLGTCTPETSKVNN